MNKTNEVSNEEKQALNKYAKENGRRWKSILYHEWSEGDIRGVLRNMRNRDGGLEALEKFKATVP